MIPKIHLYLYDLPSSLELSGIIAIDTEAMGLRLYRDRLCLVQLTDGHGQVHLVHFPEPKFDSSPNLVALLMNPEVQKLFHFGRFDITILMYTFGLLIQNVYCTKVASFLSRTYTDKHGLKDLCKTLLGIELPKKEQTSDWGQLNLTTNQKNYAANDVVHLHALKKKLDFLLERENRTETAKACFQFLPHRCKLDMMAGENFDVFAYKPNVG